MSEESATSSHRKKIALVAHDQKKNDLLDWADFNRDILVRHELIATGTTGKLVSERLGTPVECLKSGPLGGDQQIGAMIADRDIDLLVFFCDPLTAQPHEPDVQALLRLSGVWNVPIAINRSTADMAISSPLFDSRDYSPEVPDYRGHANRQIPGGM